MNFHSTLTSRPFFSDSLVERNLRENGPSRCPVDNQSLSESERRVGGQGFVHQQVDYRSGSGANYSMMNGVGAREASLSIQETQLVSDQLVNGLQQQVPHQEEGGVLANGLSYRSQETDLHASQRPDRPPYHPPYPEVGAAQAYEYNNPVQETGQVTGQLPDEHEDVPPCFQQFNVADMNGVSSTGQADQATEHSCSPHEILLWNQALSRSPPQKATRKKKNASETFHIVEITEVQQLRQVGANGVAVPFFSSAIDTDSYEYKFGVRVYLNGVGEGSGRYVSLFVHMMEGEYDDLLRWPFTGRVTLSILDRSDARHNDICQFVQTSQNSSAFARPREAICHKGCGFVTFALIEKVFGPQYVKNDKLLLKIEFAI